VHWGRRGLPFFAISSVTRRGLEKLRYAMAERVFAAAGKLFRDCKQTAVHLGGIDDVLSSVGCRRLLKPDRHEAMVCPTQLANLERLFHDDALAVSSTSAEKPHESGLAGKTAAPRPGSNYWDRRLAIGSHFHFMACDRSGSGTSTPYGRPRIFSSWHPSEFCRRSIGLFAR